MEKYKRPFIWEKEGAHHNHPRIIHETSLHRLPILLTLFFVLFCCGGLYVELLLLFFFNRRQMVHILKQSHDELFKSTHPDRYVLPWMPGGSKFMRNPPPPLEVCYPHGVPADLAESIVEVNIDQIPVTLKDPPSNSLIDFSLKEQVPDMPYGFEPEILPITGMSRPEDEKGM
jgi:hypothetical protein